MLTFKILNRRCMFGILAFIVFAGLVVFDQMYLESWWPGYVVTTVQNSAKGVTHLSIATEQERPTLDDAPINNSLDLPAIGAFDHSRDFPAIAATDHSLDVPAIGAIDYSRDGSLIAAIDKYSEPETFPLRDYLTEEEALKDDALTDIRKTVSLEKSSVKLIGDHKPYRTGEHIPVRIILRTSDGLNRTKGGDMLRVRIFDEARNAYAPGHVIDHHNGTYTAILPALWPGNQKISVTLAYTREHIRAIYHIRKTTLGSRTIAAIFTSGSRKEATACHPDRRWLTRYPDVCNLTEENGGMSWYCYKPRTESLYCHDWSRTRILTPHPKLPLTEAEEQMFKKTWDYFPVLEVEVKEQVPSGFYTSINKAHESNPGFTDNPFKRIYAPERLSFIGTLQDIHSLLPCHLYPRHLLWSRTEPTGYFYENKWNLFHCKQPDTSVFRPCLQGKHFIISGDSTTRQWYSFLFENMQCQQLTEKWTHESWHKNTLCVIPALNFTLEWLPHAQPMFPGTAGDSHGYETRSIARHIQNIGNKSNVVFVIHMHMHLTAFHYSVFRGRMKAISKSVRNILKNNKNVTFIIKGPHTYKPPDYRAIRMDDFLGYVYREIIIDEFKGLHDKVVYLDQKDMTIARGVTSVHPPEPVVKEAVFQILDYICEPSVSH